jgi:SnoaL-like domain
MVQVLVLALALLYPGAPPDTSSVRTDLQALYDEISDATLQFATESDVDLFHDVLFTPDWTFIDTQGTVQSWPQVRAVAIQALSAPRPDGITQPIQKLAVEPDGVTVIVNMIVARSSVDHEGRYGRRDASRMLDETTTFRDHWVKVADAWKLKSRQQMGKPIVSVEKPD